MIRGPILPQTRENLWNLVSPRLDIVERGLELVAAGFDCSDGQLGLVEGLARDALGAPVLVALAVEGDPLLLPRICAALEFLERVGDALACAVPEARFVPGVAGRVMVIAVGTAQSAVQALLRLRSKQLQVCLLEPFRMGSEERIAVRWQVAAPLVTGASAAELPELEVPAHAAPAWATLQRLFARLDPELKLAGTRFSRCATWRGHLLADLKVTDDGLLGVDAEGMETVLASQEEVRAYADRVVRAFLGLQRDPAPVPGTARVSRGGARNGAPNLRTSLAGARLSAEELAAFSEPTKD